MYQYSKLIKTSFKSLFVFSEETKAENEEEEEEGEKEEKAEDDEEKPAGKIISNEIQFSNLFFFRRWR